MREMKDSGVRWIGKIPTKWTIAKAKNCVEIQNGSDPKTEGSIPVYGSGSMSFKTCGEYKEGPSVLIGRKGATLHIPHYISSKFWNVDTAFNVYSKSIFDLKYYFYCAHVFDYTLYMSQTTLPSMTQTAYENMFLPLPTKEEQYAIANQLDQICSKIDAVLEKTRASIEEYKKLKQAVITQAVTKGVRGDRPMKDSGIEWIGDIPAEWKVNLIKNVATTGSGGTPESGNPSLYDGDINWICSYDLKERPITKSERRLTQLGADSIAGNVQLKGSVLVAMYGGSGTIGNSGILECEAKTNQAICSIKFNNGYITDYFGFYYILSIRKYWMIFAVGTRKDPNISQDIVRKMPCILPPIAEQEEIVAYCNKACDQLDTLITKKQQYLTEIENYKKSLIYEYVTGKKEVV